MNHPSEAPSSSNPSFEPSATHVPPLLPTLPPPPVLSFDELEPELESEEFLSGERTPIISTDRTPVDTSTRLVAAVAVEQAIRPLLHTLRQIEERLAELEDRVDSVSRPLDAALTHALDGQRRRRRVVTLGIAVLVILVGGPLVLLLAQAAGLYAG